MSTVLTKEQIDIIEEFISNNDPHDLPCVSYKDYETGKAYYNEIKTQPEGSYHIFGSNGSGYTCYAFYKAMNSKIYVMNVFMQSFEAFSIMDETWDVVN